MIIVGSGPAGVAAAKELQDRKILLLDVGFQAPDCGSLNKNLFVLKKERSSLFDEFIGENFESLHNIFYPYLSPKLKAPFFRYTTRDWSLLSPVTSKNFDVVMSFAQGGLANAWGAGVYRFTADELKEFPFSLHELDLFYDILTEEIGISGMADDLQPFFGSVRGLLPPLNLSRIARTFLKGYLDKKKYFNKKGIFIGRPRIGLLTKDYNGRAAHQYDNLEFFKPTIPSIYNPSFTLQSLLSKNKVTYLKGRLVETYQETDGTIAVLCKNLHTKERENHRCKKLILAAGAINSAKITLASSGDFESSLPILDNGISYIPLLKFPLVGKPLEEKSVYVQLNILYQGDLSSETIVAAFYGIEGPLKSDLIFDFPLDIRGNLTASKYLSSALGVIQIFYPDRREESNFLKLNPDRTLKISYEPKNKGLLERHFIRIFRKIGFLSLPFLCKYPTPGNSFHYAGTLPMRAQPQKKYETSPEGLLYGSKGVYVADAANFPYLPSKNLTFTIMANSMRIASHVKRALDQ